jgi:predicted RNase H-like HicB family nuclease
MKVTAKATRSGKWWAVEVPEIPGLFTQAKRLDQVVDMVADAAEMLGYPQVEVVIDPQLAPSVIS